MTKGDTKTFLTDIWSLASPIAYHCKNAKEHGTSQWFGGGLILQKSKMNQIHILTLDWSLDSPSMLGFFHFHPPCLFVCL